MEVPNFFEVLVRCMTYNHKAYIEDAMDGFCIQKTFLPFLCVIIEDCSTDGEQEIIKKYVVDYFESIKKEETADYFFDLCRHKTNNNCYFAIYYLKYNHFSINKSKNPYYSIWQRKCKYIALCEGDDYWIDVNKLRIQTDFLNRNKDYALCGCNGVIFYERYVEAPQYFNKIIESREIQANEVIDQWLFPTASLMWRSNIEIVTDKKFVVGDIVVVLSALKYGKIFCFSKIMTVYRKIYGGSILSKYYANKKIELLNGFVYIYETFMTLMPQYKMFFSKVIEQKKKEIAFIQQKNKSSILCFFCFPKKTIKMFVKSVKNHLIKRDHH